jgi:hypothetical protein
MDAKIPISNGNKDNQHFFPKLKSKDHEQIYNLIQL